MMWRTALLNRFNPYSLKFVLSNVDFPIQSLVFLLCSRIMRRPSTHEP
jgi:hypothetical protein